MELIEQFENEWVFHNPTTTPEIDEVIRPDTVGDCFAFAIPPTQTIPAPEFEALVATRFPYRMKPTLKPSSRMSSRTGKEIAPQSCCGWSAMMWKNVGIRDARICAPVST